MALKKKLLGKCVAKIKGWLKPTQMWTIENQLFIFVHNLHVLMNNVLTKTGTTTIKCLTDFPHLIEELKRKTKDLQNVQTSEMNQFEPENEKKKKQIDQSVTLN